MADRILAIDFGKKRIGLAIGDTETKLATGFMSIQYENHDKLIEELRKLISEENIAIIVIGLPINTDGSEGEAAIEIRRLSEKMKSRLKMAVNLLDETLTSEEAIRKLRNDIGRIDRKTGKIDMVAATVILQEYLDNLP